MNISNYAVFVKEDGVFRLIIYCGDFMELLENFEYKIYFKIKIPIFIFSYKKLGLVWYKRFCEDFYFLNLSGISILDSVNIFKDNANSSKNRRNYIFFKSISQKLIK